MPDLTRAFQDGDTLVRCAAAYGLGEAGSAAAPAMPALIQMLKRGSSNEQQITAQSLAKIGAPAVAALIEALVHESGAASEAAASALLRHYHFPTAGRPARENLPGDEAAAARQQAIDLLGASGVAEAVVVKVLTGAAVKDPAPGVRLAALKALAQGNRNVQSALLGLVACLRDESPPVREWSARTLRKIGPSAKPAIPALTRAAEDKEESVRAAAQEALETIRAGGTTNIAMPAPPR